MQQDLNLQNLSEEVENKVSESSCTVSIQTEIPQHSQRKVARTPSGCIISNPASNIRNLFSPKAKINSNLVSPNGNDLQHVDSQERLEQCVSNQPEPHKHSTEVNLMTAHSPKEQRKELSKRRIKELKFKAKLIGGEDEDRKKRKHRSHSDESDKSNESALSINTSLNTSSCDNSDNTNASYLFDDGNLNQSVENFKAINTLSEIGLCETAIALKQSGNKRYKMDEESINTEVENEDVQEFVNIRAVMTSIQSANSKIEELQRKFDAGLKLSDSEISIKKDADLQKSFDHYDKKIEELSKQLFESNQKAKLMADLMAYNQQISDDMAKRLDALEMSNIRRTAILTGLSFSGKKEILIQQLLDLFNDVLHINTSIEDAYLLGNYSLAPVVITFTTSEHKKSIFQNKSSLNTIKGESDRKVYLNDYLPTAVNEKRRRERDIIKQVKDDNPGVKITVERSKGMLKVQGQPYRKIISPPKPSDLLDLKIDEVDRILKIPTTKGETVSKQGNSFIAYGVDVITPQAVRDVYTKVRLLHPKARHIICAWNLPQVGPQFQDYCDDQEFGSGRWLLDEMKQSNIKNMAIYVVRYCGEKLAQERNKMYTAAVQSLLPHSQRNESSKTQQRSAQPSPRELSQDVPPQTKPKSTSTMSNEQESSTNAAMAFASLFKPAKTPAHAKRGKPNGGSQRGRGRGRQWADNTNKNPEPKSYTPKSENTTSHSTRRLMIAWTLKFFEVGAILAELNFVSHINMILLNLLTATNQLSVELCYPNYNKVRVCTTAEMLSTCYFHSLLYH